MSQSNDFFGPFFSQDGPFVRLPSPNGEIYIGAYRSTFEFGIPGYQRISFIRTWETVAKGKTRLALKRNDVSVEVTRVAGWGGPYPPRFTAMLATPTFKAEIRFCPMNDDMRISGVYHIVTL